MDWVLYLFGSGAVFFIGVGLLLGGQAIFTFTMRSWLQAIATLAAIAGLLLVAASATPLPYWFYAVAGGASLLWLVAERFQVAWLHTRRRWLRAE